MNETLLIAAYGDCPFCGSGGVGYAYRQNINEQAKATDGHYVVCHSCHAQGPVKPTRAEALAAWNKRMAQDDAWNAYCDWIFANAPEPESVSFDPPGSSEAPDGWEDGGVPYPGEPWLY